MKSGEPRRITLCPASPLTLPMAQPLQMNGGLPSIGNRGPLSTLTPNTFYRHETR